MQILLLFLVNPSKQTGCYTYTCFHIKNFYILPTERVYGLRRFSEQTVTISLNSNNPFVFVMEPRSLSRDVYNNILNIN